MQVPSAMLLRLFAQKRNIVVGVVVVVVVVAAAAVASSPCAASDFPAAVGLAAVVAARWSVHSFPLTTPR